MKYWNCAYLLSTGHERLTLKQRFHVIRYREDLQLLPDPNVCESRERKRHQAALYVATSRDVVNVVANSSHLFGAVWIESPACTALQSLAYNHNIPLVCIPHIDCWRCWCCVSNCCCFRRCAPDVGVSNLMWPLARRVWHAEFDTHPCAYIVHRTIADLTLGAHNTRHCRCPQWHNLCLLAVAESLLRRRQLDSLPYTVAHKTRVWPRFIARVLTGFWVVLLDNPYIPVHLLSKGA